MLEFLKDNIIPIMIVLSVAIFAFRFIRLMRREKQAENEKPADSGSTGAQDAAEDESGAENDARDGANDAGDSENGTRSI